MAYEKIVSVPSTATSGQVPQANGAGGFDWGAVDAYTKAQTLTEATKIAYGLDASAVPDDVFNAVKGLLGGGAKIATGSYVGTGTYGASNPCSLTFDFVPKLAVVSSFFWGNTNQVALLANNSVKALVGFSMRSDNSWSKNDIMANTIISWNGNSLSWYSTSNEDQFNYDNRTYQYWAIG